MCRWSHHPPMMVRVNSQRVTFAFPKILEFSNVAFNSFMVRLKKKHITKTGNTLAEIGTQLCSRSLKIGPFPSLGRH